MRYRFEISIGIAALIVAIAPLISSDVIFLRAVVIVVALGLLTMAIIMALHKPGQLDASATPLNFTFSVAMKEDLNWVAGLERRQFHDDAVPRNILQEWYETNCNGFIIIRDVAGGRLGHLNVLPVKEGDFRPFVEGKVNERSIPSTTLYTPSERAEARDLYVESVVVLGADKKVHRAAVESILASLDEIFAHVADPSNIRYIYGLAVTNSGREFMKRWGFEVVTPANEREDQHPLYRTLYRNLKTRIATVSSNA